jgi:hypothetical protein
MFHNELNCWLDFLGRHAICTVRTSPSRKEPPMTATKRRQPRPDRSSARLDVVAPAGLRFFLTEQLLEARRGSWLPTNGAGPDEDVNIYLALRLEQLALGVTDPRVMPGLDPLTTGPDPRLSRAGRAEWYGANGDHRLLRLGLFACGQTGRRRSVPWGWSADQARVRDLAVAAACYEAAARLLARGPGRGGAKAAVLAKLAERCEDYVHVLGALAVRRLNLGARLNEADLTGLVPPRPVESANAVAALLASVPVDAADVVLDLALEYRQRPEPSLRQRIERLAPRAGLDAARLLSLTAG